MLAGACPRLRCRNADAPHAVQSRSPSGRRCPSRAPPRLPQPRGAQQGTCSRRTSRAGLRPQPSRANPSRDENSLGFPLLLSLLPSAAFLHRPASFHSPAATCHSSDQPRARFRELPAVSVPTNSRWLSGGNARTSLYESQSINQNLLLASLHAFQYKLGFIIVIFLSLPVEVLAGCCSVGTGIRQQQCQRYLKKSGHNILLKYLFYKKKG